MKRVLLTGFEPFNKSTLNPSQEVISRIKHDSLVMKKVLPVTFSTAAQQLMELIDLHKPEVVVALGQSEGRDQITPERVALNLDDAKISDNAGEMPMERKIIEDGPVAYFSTLPIRKIVDKLSANGIPSAISLSAGTFVCNHLFYRLQNHCEGKGILSGFIHLPLMTEQRSEFPGKPTMAIEEITRAIVLVLDEIS